MSCAPPSVTRIVGREPQILRVTERLSDFPSPLIQVVDHRLSRSSCIQIYRTPARTHARTHTHTRTLARKHTHAHTQASTHTHTHTHTRAGHSQVLAIDAFRGPSMGLGPTQVVRVAIIRVTHLKQPSKSSIRVKHPSQTSKSNMRVARRSHRCTGHPLDASIRVVHPSLSNSPPESNEHIHLSQLIAFIRVR